MAKMNGIAAYQQSNTNWKANGASKKNHVTDTKESTFEKGGSEVRSNATDHIKTYEWKPVDTASSLVPRVKDGYGMTIGDVELSDTAKKYYDELKSKFHNLEFILVSKDMKAKVQANASAYGSSNKMVVLIDEEKLERMATDESYRKKYEGIIAMAESKIAAAKGSLTSTGANVRNFGISVSEDGTLKYFAVLEKSSAAQAKRMEEKKAEKQAAKAKEKKQAEKEKWEERLEKAKEKNSESVTTDDLDADKEYVIIKANSFEELFHKVSVYAYDSLANSVMTESEKNVGQNFDYMG